LRNLIAGLAKQPIVQFVVVGAILGFALQWWTEEVPRDDETTIRISSTDVARLDTGWRARYNRAPTPDELNGLINAQVREIALHREALNMGLDRDDQVIRRVLVQKLEGIANNLIELSLAPTDLNLEEYYAENTERYRPPSLITFTTVFIDPDLRGDRTLQDADKILAELQSRERPTEGIESFGDPFMLQRYYPEKDEQRVASLFGREFARSVFELSPGRWHGPVLSGYGTHLVYVDVLMDFPTPPLEEVREQVTQDWVDEKRREITERYFADLLAQYEVVIEGQPDAEQTDVQAASGT
jgi:peptidyl-prolyl cis-trans isomerase C